MLEDLPETLTRQEVATYFRVSAETVRKWAREKKIAYFRTPGGQVRFTREEVIRFTDRRM